MTAPVNFADRTRCGCGEELLLVLPAELAKVREQAIERLGEKGKTAKLKLGVRDQDSGTLYNGLVTELRGESFTCPACGGHGLLRPRDGTAELN